MTQLSDFSPEEIGAIVALPYRVGMHVSFAEDEDGEQDDALEMRALEACIREISKNKTGLVAEIAAEVLQRKDDWDKWSEGVFNIEPMCKQALLTLAGKASADEAKAYVRMNIEIAHSVAQAYGEFGEEKREAGFFGKLMGTIVERMNSDESSHPMNVSAAEESAIERIKSALDLTRYPAFL